MRAPMRRLTVYHDKLDLKDEVETIFEKTVTKFGSGAKIDCPLQYLGKKVYVIVRKSD
jgi:putative transposon-encoded protein